MFDLFPLARPFLNMVDGERAHRLTIEALKTLPGSGRPTTNKAKLGTRAFGLDFANPLGMAAGFDKDAEVIQPVLNMGFGFVEIGGVTPLPQPGNAKPRVFRLNRDRAVINRYGLNSAGLNVVRERLAARKAMPGIVGVNIGANKESEDRGADYVTLVKGLADHVDYISVNISSPNTPGLRNLQGKAELDQLLERIMSARASLNGKAATCPILVKIAPDLGLTELDEIIDVVRMRRINGLILSNTTIARPQTLIETRLARETGGLSGKPVFVRSTWLLAEAYQRVEGSFPLIGVGGIDSAETAALKIAAGASLLQLYTAMIYEGPGLVGRILKGLENTVSRLQLGNISEAVGSDAKAIAAEYSAKF